MFKNSVIIFVFSFFAWSLCGSLAQTQNDRDIGALKDFRDDILALLDKIEIHRKYHKLTVSKNFQQIGSRFFHIATNETRNWFSASNTCRQMGGQLATIRSKEELKLIVPMLNWDSAYWLDLNDLSDEGEFVSSASGSPASFLNWRRGQPDNYNNSDCVELINYYMYDCSCNAKRHFICEA